MWRKEVGNAHLIPRIGADCFGEEYRSGTKTLYIWYGFQMLLPTSNMPVQRDFTTNMPSTVLPNCDVPTTFLDKHISGYPFSTSKLLQIIKRGKLLL